MERDAGAAGPEEKCKGKSETVEKGVSHQGFGQAYLALEKAESFLSKNFRQSESTLEFLTSYIGRGQAGACHTEARGDGNEDDGKVTFPDFKVQSLDPALSNSWVASMPLASSFWTERPAETTEKQNAAPPKGTLLVQVLLRPDITLENLLGCFEAVALYQGLLVERCSERQVFAVSPAPKSPGKDGIQVASFKVGVASDKLRLGTLSFSPSEEEEQANRKFPLYVKLRNRFLEEKLPLSCLKGESGTAVQLDLAYVMDLIDAYVSEMMSDLQAFAQPLDAMVKEQELKGAGMMTLLQRAYDRAGVDIPRPTRAARLSHYPLVLPSEQPLLSQSQGEATASKILQAAKETLESGPYQNSDKETESLATQISYLSKATWNVLSQRCEEEAQARMKRKSLQVMDRLQNVSNHRNSLISTLLNSDLAKYSPINQGFHTVFPSLRSETVIFDCVATYGAKRGTLYFTQSHACFHASLLGFVTQVALPFHTVARIVKETTSYNLSWALSILMKNAEQHSFSLAVLEGDYVDKVVDLACFLEKRHKDEYSTTGKKNALDGEMEVCEERSDDLFAKIQRIATLATNRESCVQQKDCP